MGLAWTEGIPSHALNGRGGVDEKGVAAVALYAAVDKAECLIDGEDLRVEDLFVVA